LSHREKRDPELKLAITSANWKAASAIYCATAA
jgi:hypothetical protein